MPTVPYLPPFASVFAMQTEALLTAPNTPARRVCLVMWLVVPTGIALAATSGNSVRCCPPGLPPRTQMMKKRAAFLQPGNAGFHNQYRQVRAMP
ncbi:MAG TPA: hypothetical protein VKV19_14685 [Ktedonobacteraceae bacterium]|nr:hypothetical protein [Ktedonobacteraceae bacterium]